MPHSMTGYGAARGSLSGGELAVEIRTVNHRHFAAQFKLPSSLQRFEAKLRTRLREGIERGHVAVSARWSEEPPRAPAVRLNLDRARAVVNALAELKSALDLVGEIDLAFVARQPEVLTLADEGETEVDEDQLMTLIDRAVEDVLGMRAREGAALGADLERRLSGLEREVGRVEARAPRRLQAERDRLRRKVSELMDGRQLDESRLVQEIALLADKLDITEELVRLRAHIQASRELLAGDQPAGRPLAFLGQEMLREINTIGSKASDAEITNSVVAMKGELEKFREQAENIE